MSFGASNSGSFGGGGSSRTAGVASHSEFTVLVDATFGGANLMQAAVEGVGETVSLSLYPPNGGRGSLEFLSFDGIVSSVTPAGPANSLQHHIMAVTIAPIGKITVTSNELDAKGGAANKTSCSYDLRTNLGADCADTLQDEPYAYLDPRGMGAQQPGLGIELTAFSLPMSRSVTSGAGGSREASRPNFGDASASGTTFTSASVNLWATTMNGQILNTFSFGYLAGRDYGFSWFLGEADYAVELRNVLVSSYSLTANADGFGQSFSMGYRTVEFQTPRDGGGSDKYGWDVEQGQPL